MFYYKVMEEDDSISYEERFIESHINNSIKLTKEEYDKAIKELQEELENEVNESQEQIIEEELI